LNSFRGLPIATKSLKLAALRTKLFDISQLYKPFEQPQPDEEVSFQPGEEQSLSPEEQAQVNSPPGSEADLSALPSMAPSEFEEGVAVPEMFRQWRESGIGRGKYTRRRK
jgi:hypothetical protein